MIHQSDTLNFPAFVSNYLKKYSDNTWKLELKTNKKFNNVVVIPAIQEFNNIIRLLDSIAGIDTKYFFQTLFIFVINNTANADDEILSDNKETLKFLRKLSNRDSAGDSLIGKLIKNGINIGVVDASTPGNELSEKDGGVGLARKIGMDLALTVFDYKSSFEKIIICLDADCIVDNNYLTVIVDKINEDHYEAGYIDFEHQMPVNETEKKAIICYEIFLRYYVLGLSFAGSVFAFHTIGSTIFCCAENYCKVGGMNKRKAAEDFYFIEKLAKVTLIQKIKDTKVHPSGRGSWRVPFGTGQRVNRFLSDIQNEYLLYDPQIFLVLKEWLEIFNNPIEKKSRDYLNDAEKIVPELKRFLELNQFEENWNKIINNSKSAKQIQKQKIMWFDGFRTMKLIHFLRDNGYPQINMFEALDKLFVLVNIDTNITRSDIIPDVDTQLEYLNLLRSIE